MTAPGATTPAPVGTPDQWLYWGLPVAVMAVFLGGVLWTRYGLLSRLRARARLTDARWDDVLVEVLASVRAWLLAPALVYWATRSVTMPGWLERTLHVLAVVGLAVQAVVTLRVLIDAGLDELDRRSRQGNEGSGGLASSLTVLRVMSLGVAGVLVGLAALDNMGVSVTPLITGLGIGGVAVALAVQSVLSDLFGSLSIILDKPFVVGDFIIAGKEMGTVERIGIKTTRIRALSGEQLVFSNRDLLDSRIQNFKRMQERRAVFTFSVSYATDDADLEAIPGIVRHAIEEHPKARFDRAHLQSLGEHAIVFECVYIVRTPEYNDYMDINQAIHHTLLREFRRRGIELAVKPLVALGAAAPAGAGAAAPGSETQNAAPTNTAAPGAKSDEVS